ncbi:MAG: hypothetical protein ABIS51_16715 [Sphingomonas sp.]
MRIILSDLDRPKTAAKLIARCAPEVNLSAAQEAIAKAVGYRDWHELGISLASVSASPTLSLEQIMGVILSLSDALGVEYGDMQFVISKSRLLGDQSLDETLRLRAMIWRDRLFGTPARGKPGTIVRINAPGEKRAAYLKSFGRPARLIYDTGFGSCADFEVVTPRVPLEDFVPSRLWLPYGFWTLRDGGIVTFSRDYKPMWRTSGRLVERLHPWLWVNRIEQEAHFSTLAGSLAWSSGLARSLALDHLKQQRVSQLPLLLDAMPYLLESHVESISDAVDRMRDHAEVLAA